MSDCSYGSTIHQTCNWILTGEHEPHCPFYVPIPRDLADSHVEPEREQSRED